MEKKFTLFQEKECLCICGLCIPSFLQLARSQCLDVLSFSLLPQALLWLAAAATPTSSPVNAITSSHSLTVEVIKQTFCIGVLSFCLSNVCALAAAQMHMNAIVHIRTYVIYSMCVGVCFIMGPGYVCY